MYAEKTGIYLHVVVKNSSKKPDKTSKLDASIKVCYIATSSKCVKNKEIFGNNSYWFLFYR